MKTHPISLNQKEFKDSSVSKLNCKKIKIAGKLTSFKLVVSCNGKELTFHEPHKKQHE